MVGVSSVGATWSLLYLTPTELKYIYIATLYKHVAPLGLLAATIDYTFDDLLRLKYIYITNFYKHFAPLGLLAAAINYTFDELLRRSSVFIEKSIYGWGQLRRSYVIASLPNSYGVEIHLHRNFL